MKEEQTIDKELILVVGYFLITILILVILKKALVTKPLA